MLGGIASAVGRDLEGYACLTASGRCLASAAGPWNSAAERHPQMWLCVTAITSRLRPPPYPADEWTKRSRSVRRVGGLHMYTAFGMIMGAMIGCAVMAQYGLGFSM